MHVLWIECALYCYVVLYVYILENACSLDRMRFILLRCIICVYCRECMFFWSNALYTVTLYYMCIF